MSNMRTRTTSSTSTNRLSLNKNSNDANTQKSAKKKALTKPAWDPTNSDLTQLKPSNEEIERRKASCKSKNIEIVKYEKQKQDILKNKKIQQSKADPSTQLALLKEILHDDEQLKNLILKSDSTLKIVQNFFKDDSSNSNLINKKQAKINLTLAPNVTDLNESNLPHYATQNCKDKQSGITQVKCQNVNSLSDGEESDPKNNKSNEQISNTMINLKDINLKNIEECLKMLVQNQSNTDQTPPNQKSNLNLISSINDTEKVSRLKSSQDPLLSKSSDEVSFLTSNSKHQHATLSGLNDEFNKALFELENKLNDFEKHCGKHKNADNLIKRTNLNQSKQPSYSSSYTLTLIQIVSSLLDYLRDAIIELNYEKLKQVESNKQLDIHRKLIDGLTTEILTVKEQNEKIISDFSNQNSKLSSEIDHIKLFLRSSSGISQNQVVTGPQSIDSRPRLSAFTSQSQLNLDTWNNANIIKPIAQQQSLPQHHSFTNSNNYNHGSTNDFNSKSNLFDDLNREDKFSERLNAMLQFDTHSNNLVKSTSVAHFQNLYGKQFINQNRPLSATFSNSVDLNNEQQDMSNINSNNQIAFNNRSTLSLSNTAIGQNKQPNLEFNTQIDDLKMKNLQVQHRLKQLQQEHRDSLFKQESKYDSSDSMQELESNNADLHNNPDMDQKIKNEALDKLKQEQQLLKNQINMLNKQRESAKQELEILSVASSASNKKENHFIQNTLIKHLSHMNSNFENENNTPNLSPIPPENLISERNAKINEQRYSQYEANECLEITPTRFNGYKMK